MKTKFNGILTLLLALVVQISFAQDRTISGVVSDETGPLPGVTVLKKGTTQGTETDFNGNYSVKAKTGDVLVYSFVGMKTIEKTVGSSNTIDVILESANVLDEVIVTGYTSTRKSEITGAAVKIDSESISQVVTANVDNALQGKVAGVAISGNSGTPGSVATIRIRGNSSINASNDPLYVIDGVPVTSGNISSSTASSSLSAISAIDSNNIESITVLKDASATAQYGARGTNGVILITTKSGKKGKTRFTLNTSYGFQNDAVAGPQPLTAANHLELLSEAYFNDGYFASKADAESWILTTNHRGFGDWDAQGRREANWGDAVANDNAPIQTVSLSASGGGEGHTFFASLGYLKQEATVIGSEFERISAAVNLTKDLSEKFKFSTNNSVSYVEQDSFLENSAYFESPRTAKYFLSPLLYPYNDDGSPAEIGGSLPNPLILTRDNTSKNLFTRIVSNNALEWNIGNGWSAGTRLNIDYQIYHNKFFGNRNYGYSAPNNGEASQYHRNNVTYVVQNYVDYKWDVNDDHSLDFKLLQEYQTNRSYFLGAAGRNFADDGLINLNSAGRPDSINSSFYDWFVGAYLGIVHYSAYNGKYVADLSFRREGNSRFAPKQRWGNFWSVGGAWNINKESFLADSEVVDALKLRASYGVTGNAGIDLNSYQSLIAFDQAYGGAGAGYLSSYGEENLTWETAKSFDVALEFGLFNKVSGSIGYYSKTSEDLLLEEPLSLTSGFPNQDRNIGSLVNKGIEFDINYDVVKSDDFNLSIGGNFATVDNEVTKLALDPNGNERTVNTTTTRIATGHSVREFYMPTWAGS